MTHELYKTKEEIENWLNKYNIENYELIEDKDYVYVVNVNDYVLLSTENLEYIPIKFNIVNGGFNCENNKLTNLEFAPKLLKGSFYCKNNKLLNLKGSPIKVNNFDVSNNELTTLEGCPENIYGYMNMKNNKIKNLNFLPKRVDDFCYLSYNEELKELQYINDFEDLKLIILHKKLEKEITIDNKLKTAKIKL